MASLEKHQGRWSIRYRVNGKKKRKNLVGVETKRHALQLLRQFEEEQLPKTVQSALSLSEYVAEYLAAHRLRVARSTHERVRSALDIHLLPAFGDRSMEGLETSDLVFYFSRRDAKHGTLVKELHTLKAVINSAVKARLIYDNPIKDFSLGKNKESRPPPYYDMDEIGSLWKHCNHRPRWQFLVNTGLRRGEVMQLRHQHIVDDVVRVISTEGETTKSYKHREVPLNDMARDALAELKNDIAWQNGMDERYVFPRMNARSLTRAFDKDARRASLPGSLHWLRHTFCTLHVLSGTPLRAIQELAGHSTIKVTEQYTHVQKRLGQYGNNINV
jgi:integrase